MVPIIGERIEIKDGQIGFRDDPTGLPDVVLRRAAAGGIECLTDGRASSFGSTDMVGNLLGSSTFEIAHRGGGEDGAEHTFETYTQARDAGASAVEVSFWRCNTGQLVCIHDEALDRTTDSTGDVTDRAWSDLEANVTVDIGASWNGPSAPARKIPLLSKVLDALANRTVVFLEAKSPDAKTMDAVLDLLDQYRDVGQWLVWKFYRSTGGELPAHAKTIRSRYGARLWQYCDAADSDAVIQRTGAVADAIGLPLAATTDAKFQVAVATGTPVIVYPIARRYDMHRLRALGVQGLMCSSWRYLTTDHDTRLFTEDQFATGLRMPGDIQYASTTPPYCTITKADGCITLPSGTASSVCLGSMSTDDPDAVYTVSWAMRWPTLPTASLHSDFVLCQADDRPYKHQDVASDSGYHVVIRPVLSGGDPTHAGVQLYSHVLGSGTGTLLGADNLTAAIVANTWATFTIEVTATQLTLTRTDVAGTPVVVANALYRGGYIYLAAASSDQPVDFKDVTIT